MAAAFFIQGNTKPIDGAGNKFGSAIHIVLYDALSKNAADRWSADFVTERLLRRHPEQRLTRILVTPVHSHLLTSGGETGIDWPSFTIEAQGKYNKSEIGSTMSFIVRGGENPGPLALDSLSKWKESIKNRISDPDRFNWDERKKFFYIVYHSHQAYIVEAVNAMLASRIYSCCVRPASAEETRLQVKSWPGSVCWQNSSQ